MEKKNKSIIQKDSLGHYHFNGNFNNVSNVRKALNELKEHSNRKCGKDKIAARR
jgi:hypothetical protein